MNEKYKNLKTLFFSNLYISACTFGGGMVIVTFMKKKFVDELHFIEKDEMLDMTALAQSSPGAIAINTSILVGYKIAGLTGILVSVLATILPPITILMIISSSYEAFISNSYISVILKGMQAGVAAVLIDVVFELLLGIFRLKNPLQFLVMPLTFVANFMFKINIFFIIIAGILLGIITQYFKLKGGETSK